MRIQFKLSANFDEATVCRPFLHILPASMDLETMQNRFDNQVEKGQEPSTIYERRVLFLHRERQDGQG